MGVEWSIETRTNKRERFGGVYLLVSALFWSLSGVLVKSVAWSGLSLAATRGMLSFLACCCLANPFQIKFNRVKLISGFCYFMQGILLVTANKFTTAGHATILQNTSPIYIILLNAIILSVRPKKLDLITCAGLIVGISLCLVGNFYESGTLGNVLAMISAVFYAAVFFTNRLESANALESLVIGNAMYLLLIPLVIRDAAVCQSTPTDLAIVIAFSLLSGTLAWLCFSIGIKTISALRANFITILEPILSPLWALLFLGERMDTLSIIGCVCVIITLIVYNTTEAKKQ